MISTSDLKNALLRLGYASVDDKTVHSIISEVDQKYVASLSSPLVSLPPPLRLTSPSALPSFSRRGSIGFDDFLEIAAGLKELSIESAFTHIALGEEGTHPLSAPISVDRSGGGA